MTKTAYFWLAIVCASILSPGRAVAQNQPDPELTPGATNPEVTQETIDETICVKGWTRTIRPSTAYTNELKRIGLADYGHADADTRLFEEDHRVPLEVGGNPVAPRNLWPEPYEGDWNARVKDKLENFARREVCSKEMSLADAQALFLGDWIASFNRYCGPIPESKCPY